MHHHFCFRSLPAPDVSVQSVSQSVSRCSHSLILSLSFVFALYRRYHPIGLFFIVVCDSFFLLCPVSQSVSLPRLLVSSCVVVFCFLCIWVSDALPVSLVYRHHKVNAARSLHLTLFSSAHCSLLLSLSLCGLCFLPNRPVRTDCLKRCVLPIFFLV